MLNFMPDPFVLRQMRSGSGSLLSMLKTHGRSAEPSVHMCKVIGRIAVRGTSVRPTARAGFWAPWGDKGEGGVHIGVSALCLAHRYQVTLLCSLIFTYINKRFM